jgi:Mrp family chromosome partitioning ATPase
MILSDPAFPALLDRLLGDYDRVIVDSAPVNAVSDTLLLAKHFNAVCLVVRSGKTPRAAVERAVRLLGQSGANTIGTILNRLSRGYGADYYYYYYGDRCRRAQLMGKRVLALSRCSADVPIVGSAGCGGDVFIARRGDRKMEGGGPSTPSNPTTTSIE